MAINKGALLLITLFLASASLSLAYSKDQLVQELDQCLHRCNILRWSPERVRSCEADCAHDYYTKTQQEPQNEENDVQFASAEECKSWCVAAVPRLGLGSPQKCIDRCEQKLGHEDTSLNQVEPMMKQYKLEMCRRKCQVKGIPYEQTRCEQKCESKYGQAAQPMAVVGENSGVIVSDEDEQYCWSKCGMDQRPPKCMRACRMSIAKHGRGFGMF